MSTNVDNVYSNAGQKALNKQEERGYKVYVNYMESFFLSKRAFLIIF